MRILFIILVPFFALIISCRRNVDNSCHDFSVQDYTVIISFSSAWECGTFKQIILNNNRQENSYLKERFKPYKLYTIITKDNCKFPDKSDTLIVDLRKALSDSIFDLANAFIKDFKLQNHIGCDSTRTLIEDGADLLVKISLENKSIMASYDHYTDIDSISETLNDLLNYIDRLNAKK